MTSHAVIFDLFDTLVDGDTAGRRAVIGEMGTLLGADPHEFAEAFRASHQDRFAGRLGDLAATVLTLSRRCGVEPAPAAVERAIRLRMEHSRRLLTPLPGVREELSRLSAAGWRLGLLTNCSIETVRAWPDSALARYFARPVFSCEVGLSKPDPAVFRLAAERLGVAAAECAYVADGAGGELVAAARLGMTTIRVRANDVDHATFGGIGDWSGPVVDDLSTLSTWLVAEPGE